MKTRNKPALSCFRTGDLCRLQLYPDRLPSPTDAVPIWGAAGSFGSRPAAELVVLLLPVTLPSIRYPRPARDAQRWEIILSDGRPACCYERHLCLIQEEV